ncbi:MAG TPA: PilZ domain-containing protein [Terracidiphilus sp.]|nr:PilZ domain-containing protein [Terracidiphilus sp.]
MYGTQEAEKIYEKLGADGELDTLLPGGTMESRTHCAYNQTRECFLGLEVTAADLSYAGIVELMATITLRSGEGLWIVPFRGVPATGLPAPLDLIYLDEDCRVIDLVESFPTFRVSSSSPRAASVLVLPVHSIYSSQTQVGDQLVLCIAEEMEQRLERITNLRGDPAATIQSAVLLREKPLWSGGPGLLELEKRAKEDPGLARRTHEMPLVQPGEAPSRPPRTWLERWWSPDPRKAPREIVPGLAAYYWNGAAPEAHGIRDISSSGMYVVTEERWYPGTLVLMTLQRTDCGDEIEERSIAVQSRAVRWGNDGVGLKFVLPEEKDLKRGHNMLAEGVDKKALERFLQKLKKDN